MNKIQNILPKYSHSEIDDFDNEDKFMDAYVELLKQSIELIEIVMTKKYFDEKENPKIINRNDAVIGGNLTRLFKLNFSILQNICNGQIEICYIINRCLAETAINIIFLLREDETVKRQYIKHSLLSEKELWESIVTNVKNRDGDVLPIEERMQKSILKSFDKSDFDLEEIKRSSKWKSIKFRSEKVFNEQFYAIYYGMSTHSVHGNWQDILDNDLIISKDAFKLNREFNLPRPQIVEGPISLNFNVIYNFCERELKNFSISKDIMNKCIELQKYLSDLSEHHEILIMKKAGNKREI